MFGWTADKAQSFEALDAYLAAGGNFIDTSDSYMNYFPEQGNEPGQSETIIGNWLAARGNREDVIGRNQGRRPPAVHGRCGRHHQSHLPGLGGGYADTERGVKVLDALEQVATARCVEMAIVALAWLAQQPTVTAPIASARIVEQLPALLAAHDLQRSDAELQTLTAASS
ncbi:aldo/keto reductase [Amycolatopsis pithecellobii]|uniref:aldo/keto reductase n=1 Tax=Amycolatopsis pithecellobii TaxID=664692 RepID=UPI0035E4128C